MKVEDYLLLIHRCNAITQKKLNEFVKDLSYMNAILKISHNLINVN